MKKFVEKIKGSIILPFYLLFKLIKYSHVIEILLLPILIIIKVRDIIVKNNCKNGEEHVESILANDTGHFIYITGVLGAGKTTMMAGLSHFYTLIFLRMINKDMERCKSILIHLDYLALNSFIADQRDNNKRYEEIYESYLNSDIFVEFKDGMYDDGININKYNELLFKYIRAYYRLLDNNFVMSNIEIKSRITGNSSLELKKDYLKLKLKNCPIELFQIISLDEATLGENNAHTSDIKSEDDGQADTLRLSRNMSEGTWFINFVAQNMSRDLLMYRELATSELNILNRSIKEIDKCKSLILKLQLKLLNIDEWFYKKIKNIDSYIFDNTFNEFKAKRFDLQKKIDKINASAYLIYNVDIYLKKNGERFSTNFTMPISWCFGTVDTYYFKFILKYIKMESKLSYYDLKSVADLSWDEKVVIAEELLSQKNKKKTRAERSEENRKKHAEENARKAKAIKKTVEHESTDNTYLSSNENGEV